MKLYAFSGLGADERVFKNLDINADIIPIQWISPKKNEKIEDYTKRITLQIDDSENYGILGLSFGGLIAVEVSKILNPTITILISSVKNKNELPLSYRILGKINILRFVPSYFFSPPTFIARYLFGTKQSDLLHAILRDTDLNFAKWAVNALVNWQNPQISCNKIIKINGTKDCLIPHSNDDNYLIKGGKHFMIIDESKTISQLISDLILPL